MKTTVNHIRHTSDTIKDNPNQISVANKAPAVPGAKGEKPEPKPVPMSTGKKEGFFIDKKRNKKDEIIKVMR